MASRIRNQKLTIDNRLFESLKHKYHSNSRAEIENRTIEKHHSIERTGINEHTSNV